MVYVAFGVFFIGTGIRLVKIFRAPAHPASLKIFPEKKPSWMWIIHDTFLFPTVRRHQPLLWIFLMIFHLGLVLLLIGHLELVWEIDAFQIIPHDVFLGNGFVGLGLLIAVIYFLFRRFRSPVRELSVPGDYYLLILLFLVFLFGSEMDWARSWYEYGELAAEDYQAYLYSLVVLKPELPDAVLYSGHSFMLVLHVFFANLLLIFFPFSKLMHTFLSIPANRLRRR
jgi:nitrate reductase gamma subunit